MPAIVYFTDARALHNNESFVAKTIALFNKANFDQLFEPGDYVAVKLHMGEYNNTGYIRPVYVRAIVERIKQAGGIPFVTDTCTLPYHPWAARTNPIDHLKTIARNGFTMASVGAPIVIADGFGNDDILVDLPEGLLLKEQYIASGFGQASAMILLSHFKGHMMGTFGGAIKNLGVGCASLRGKFNLHLARHPTYGLHKFAFNPSFCKGKECKDAARCEALCPTNALKVTETGLEWDRDKCCGCYAHLFATLGCGTFTTVEQLDWLEATSVAIADSAKAAQKLMGKDHVGFINFALDISPWCDCMSWTDAPIVPDIGIIASTDPVALDRCCLDKVTESPGMLNSAAESKDVIDAGIPKMSACGSFLGVSENIQVNTGVDNGLGELKYTIKKVTSLPSKDMDSYGLYIDSGYAGINMGRLFSKRSIFPNPKADDGGFKRAKKVDFGPVRIRRE
ncbi:MAG: DUF362 domain-containing protein [Candidatus Helarchaeota archaeon]|nr:DUF362 domain-containing protein [Candidatus Helarchaeota archaeon]